MRKVYVILAYWKQSGNRHVAAVTTSYKKAQKYVAMFTSEYVNYEIKTEVLI